jgi:hypothetical protein
MVRFVIGVNVVEMMRLPREFLRAHINRQAQRQMLVKRRFPVPWFDRCVSAPGKQHQQHGPSQEIVRHRKTSVDNS